MLRNRHDCDPGTIGYIVRNTLAWCFAAVYVGVYAMGFGLFVLAFVLGLWAVAEWIGGLVS